MYQESFRDLKQVEGIISLIDNGDIFEAFKWMNLERTKPLFIPETFVKRIGDGNYCSNCSYRFEGEESDYNYCVSCLEELACCDDEHCDRDNDRAEESAISFLEGAYYNLRKN